MLRTETCRSSTVFDTLTAEKLLQCHPIYQLDIIAMVPTNRYWQCRREGVCRPGQTSVLPPPPIRSILQSGYFSVFRTWGVNQLLRVPFFPVPSYFLSIPSPSPNPFPPLEVAPLIQPSLGKAVSSASGVWGGVPADIEFGAF